MSSAHRCAHHRQEEAAIGNALHVIGAGGHAKVVISTAQAAGYSVAAVYDDDPHKRGATVYGIPIVGSIAELPDSPAIHAVVAIGDNSVRCEVALRFRHVHWVTVVHPRAYLDPTVRLGEGTVVCAGAVVQPDTVLGAHVIINTGATVDHDCVIAGYAHLAPGSHVAGGVSVGSGTLVGIGSCVIPQCCIGNGVTVGAGAVVVHDVADSLTVAGVPARAHNRRRT